LNFGDESEADDGSETFDFARRLRRKWRNLLSNVASYFDARVILLHEGASKKEGSVDGKEKMTSIGQPVPELPVADVERAQQHYKDALGFEIGWLYPGKEIGAVSRGRVAIFFRKRTPPFEPAVHWVFADDIDASYQELQSLGANIVDPLEKKPWGLRQFTVQDLDGNLFYFHHD
jgi:predicted enzyme related to lactoylglutathione lyase